MKVFTITFYPFNTSLLNKSINLFKEKRKKKITDPKLLNSTVYCNTKFLF